MEPIDAGVNFRRYVEDGDLEQVIRRAKERGLHGILAICNSLSEMDRYILPNLKLDETFHIWHTAGIHPHNAKTAKRGWLTELRSHLKNGAVFVGECGLDFDRMYSPRDLQINIFAQQISIAAETGTPLYLHIRGEDAHETAVAMLSSAAQKPLRGIVHCFTGTHEEAQTYVELGLYIGITAWMLKSPKNREEELRYAIQNLDLSKIIIETDSPFITPYEYSRYLRREGRDVKRNEPESLELIAEEIAVLKNTTLEEVVNASTSNFKKLISKQDS